jgi:hypothetical protein
LAAEEDGRLMQNVLATGGIVKNRTHRKPYEEPTVRRLTGEQAKLNLMGHVIMGDQNAMELLDMLFQDEKKKTRIEKEEGKKSA